MIAVLISMYFKFLQYVHTLYEEQLSMEWLPYLKINIVYTAKYNMLWIQTFEEDNLLNF